VGETQVVVILPDKENFGVFVLFDFFVLFRLYSFKRQRGQRSKKLRGETGTWESAGLVADLPAKEKSYGLLRLMLD
jgi:hypothetical protein